MSVERTASSTPVGPRRHDVGPGGTVHIAVEADDVRIRGVDGTEARVVSPADGAGIVTAAEPGRFTVQSAGAPRGAFVGVRIGGRGFGISVSGTIEVEVPRDARVEVGSTAGDVAVRDVRGGLTVRTASGDVSVKRADGPVAVSVASGDVMVTGSRPVSLDVRSASGDVRARASRFERLAIETISGDAEIAGAFGTTASHRVSTVSGDLELALVGGLTVEVKTISGDVECSHPARRSGDGRRQPLVIGDGAAHLAVRTTSGDVEVRAGTPVTDDADAPKAATSPRAPLPPLPPAPVRPEVTAPEPPRPPAAPDWPSLEETRVAPPAAPATGEAAAGDDVDVPADATTLTVLEALARGEIDIAEAERRLSPPTELIAEAAADEAPGTPTAPGASDPGAAGDEVAHGG